MKRFGQPSVILSDAIDRSTLWNLQNSVKILRDFNRSHRAVSYFTLESYFRSQSKSGDESVQLSHS